MSLKAKIKEAMTDKNTPEYKAAKKSPVKWDADTQPNLYALSEFLRKAGYRLIDAIEHEGNKVELLIEPIEEGHLHPDIIHDIDNDIFCADIIKYGLLGKSDLEEVIKGYETALGVIKYLDTLHLNKMEVNIEDNE